MEIVTFASMKERKSYTVEEATRKLEQYCAYQERCHKEVQEKLREMNMIPLAADTIIAHLIEHNFLNEERFARSFARGKFRIKKWGRHRIVRELKARDISAYAIKAALKEIDVSSYYETLSALAKKRWISLQGETNLMRKRKKLTDYLLYRGWETELIQEVLRELEVSDPTSDAYS